MRLTPINAGLMGVNPFRAPVSEARQEAARTRLQNRPAVLAAPQPSQDLATLESWPLRG
jgi:hypothetical protein